jgi:hypothetical protein
VLHEPVGNGTGPVLSAGWAADCFIGVCLEDDAVADAGQGDVGDYVQGLPHAVGVPVGDCYATW